MAYLPDNLTLIYITNPMCTWCYGMTPVLRRLRALWHKRLNVQVLLGDLQAPATEPLLPEQKQQMALLWHRVQERTYLPFDYRFFLQKNCVFNTEPACQALLCIRLLRPVLTLEVLRAMHSAFFADGLDLANTGVLVRIARLFGITENLFLALFESDEITEQLKNEFEYVDHLTAGRLPGVYLATAHGTELLSRGFCPLDELEQRLLQVLEQSGS
ncbi:DsbA family protein [Pontibacter chitinilyticus]|uniref:DsbA family protein n=1 Tax=Pontibacter chitinilyticus TaxID=2674989 RepID=UPI003219C772